MGADWQDVEILIQRVNKLERRVAALEPKKTEKAKPTGPHAAAFRGMIAASTFAAVGSIDGDTLTVTSADAGSIVPGATISGAGAQIGTQVGVQITPLNADETMGGVGRYKVSIAGQTVPAGTALTGTYGTMTVTEVGNGAIVLGGVIAGEHVVDGTTVTQFLTGAGGNGTYVVSDNTIVPATRITQTAAPVDPAKAKTDAPAAAPASQQAAPFAPIAATMPATPAPTPAPQPAPVTPTP